MTTFNCCGKILAGFCVISLATTGVLAFQQQTTITRQQSISTTRRAPELQLNLGGNDEFSRWGKQNKFLPSQLRQPQSQRTSSTSLTVSLGRGNSNSNSNSKKSILPDNFQGRIKLGFLTILRVVIPSILAGVVAFIAFPQLCLWLCSLFQDQGVFAVLSQDSSQFVQNFLSVSSLLFSILVGQTYYFMYQQQEMVYYALFDEVTEAKSLLEQVALVSQGRSMYKRVLECMSIYVESDLKALDKDPALLLSSRPMDDPLETIMYLTSVGVPGAVYDTVRSLRQARARRLGALQRKLPSIHLIMLWTLAALELVSFPLLGAGTQTIGGYNVLTIEGLLFAIMTAGIVLTLRVVKELWRPTGGAYNVDGVLRVMVRGLEKELEARQKGMTIKAPKGKLSVFKQQLIRKYDAQNMDKGILLL
eukprot:CAMPEP_0116136286 /NCGR_PEP_ID=MMETSP0329-20121206/11640_1 /TAXON_ID=697910 /ORGANISM="Pseudo-nitzschia arenysensis, Strain B593" /LENGTH=418 /DNA_ID=CAMNT_0003631137 /DNA_START=52 /DNA_END=1303 /DNA_ORIENTATION=-